MLPPDLVVDSGRKAISRRIAFWPACIVGKPEQLEFSYSGPLCGGPFFSTVCVTICMLSGTGGKASENEDDGGNGETWRYRVSSWSRGEHWGDLPSKKETAGGAGGADRAP